jgi:peptidoglycan/LPS O-acetylase OafA/YrhL
VHAALFGSTFLVLLVLGTAAVIGLWPALERRVSGSELPGREPQLDGLRGLLALSVILHHGMVTHAFFAGRGWVAPPENFDSLAGSGAVAMFFMASAYLFWGRVIRSGGALDSGSFFAGRVRRLVPMYAVALALFLAIVAIQTRFTLRVPLRAVLEQVVRWSSFCLMDVGNVNGFFSYSVWSVVWTLQYEWLFYLLLPFFAFAYRAMRWPWLLYVAIFAMAATFPSLVMAFFFAAGAVSVYVVERCRRWPWMRWTFAALGLGAVPVLVQSFHEADRFTEGWYNPEPALLLFAMFVASLSGAGPWALLRWKPLGFLGHISYSVYLLHQPMIYIVSVFGLGPSQYAAMRPLALYATLLAIGAMTITVSTVTFIFVEKPFLRRVALAAKPVGRAIPS